jgi:hypothetical protein
MCDFFNNALQIVDFPVQLVDNIKVSDASVLEMTGKVKIDMLTK